MDRPVPNLVNGPTGTSSRIPALDGVRGLAIVLVVISHAGIGGLASGGRVGVTLFFVLSGFLITRLLIAEKVSTGSIRISAFYGRRALRLLPALVVYLLGIATIFWWRRLDVPIWDMTWPPALYVANYVQILGRDLFANRHTWSLAVEEHFYLIWPLLVALGAARRLRPLAIGVGVLLAWRLGVATVNPYWAYRGSDTNAYALGLGCLLAVAQLGHRIPRLPQVATVVGLAALGLLSFVPTTMTSDTYLPAIWLPPVAAGLSALLIAAALQHESRILTSKALRWFGLISYSLYLWHAPLLQVPGLGNSPVGRIVAVGIAIGFAWGSWELVERRVLRNKWRSAMDATQGGVPADMPLKPTRETPLPVISSSFEATRRLIVTLSARIRA